MASSGSKSLFTIHYRDPKDGQIQSLKVRSISDSTLGLGFIRISDFVFETQGAVIQPIEEQMQKKLANTKSLHLSIYSVISIEELSETALQFKLDKSKLLVLPSNDAPPQKS